ncbi:MAG TPA: protein YgfX [Halioglobus sp.]
MSARYSTSPALELKIGKSRLRALLYAASCLVNIYTLWLLSVRGHIPLAVLLMFPVTCLLWRLRRDPMEGLELRWQRGTWTLEHAGVRRVIAPTARSAVTPWVIYLPFSDLSAGSRGYLWLFVDSLSTVQLRRLRVRLTLQH